MLGITETQNNMNVFLQGTQEPDYEFHSDGILSTLEDLNEDFSKRLEDSEADLARAIKAHEELMTEERQSLSLSQHYLKDLTKQCELKAREYDQRSGLRNNEIAALTKALDILKNRVLKNEGKRTFLNQSKAVVKSVITQDIADDDMSFVQTKKVTLLRQMTMNKKNKALAQLNATAKKIHSFELLQASDMIKKAGVFDKVKKLIAKLIERLL